ncbi:MAG: P1 family peptidase [Bryobacteraceae bacterium]|nr:P1 family peptidase [Bryobacterales bacterium]MEB2359902.1 P1 family peptidase [Bryobacterales bacterium]NUN03823.1 P1 family peptidase [Bryobacteraceae bacterium]
MKLVAAIAAVMILNAIMIKADTKPRARDLGVPFEGKTGPLNAITDIGGIEVGHTTLIRGEGPLKVGEGPVRTGVTVILPRGKKSAQPVFAGWFSLNGNGEMTGTTWVEESGLLEGPVAITNTHSVGTVRDAIIQWQVRHGTMYQDFSLPVVAETYDGWLNDINGFHVKPEHVFSALEAASAGPVEEGNVGGGTGMNCYSFKGGIGTASRQVSTPLGSFTLGVLVQANFGRRYQLKIAGAPVGQELTCDKWPCRSRGDAGPEAREGSIIVVAATDAPLLPHQLKRIARRVSLGIARTGSSSGNGSGDIFIAFSTGNRDAGSTSSIPSVLMLPNAQMDALFEATAQATEEAIINAMVAAETMTGRDGHRSIGLPHKELREALRKYNRLSTAL